MTAVNALYRGIFPKIDLNDFKITSPQTPKYNCIAWAAHVNDRWWWPSKDYYWPPGLPLQETVENFINAFATLGYAPCADGCVEEGIEKVVIYAVGGLVKHMARQLSDGTWTSKLGMGHDVSHGQDWHLSGNAYGQCVQYLHRKTKGVAKAESPMTAAGEPLVMQGPTEPAKEATAPIGRVEVSQ